MLRLGCAILSLWAVLNVLPSAFIVFDTIFRGGHTPAIYLVLSKEEFEALPPTAVATIDSIAVFANGVNVAFCAVSLSVVWMALYRRQVWAFWGLLAGFTCALLAGVGGDYEVGYTAPWVNWISGGILALGLTLSAGGLFRRRPDEAS